MTTWKNLTFEHPNPKVVLDDIKHEFDLIPENTRVRVKDGQIQITTLKEEDKFDEIILNYLPIEEVAAHSWVSDTTDTGGIKAKRVKDGEFVYLEEKFSEEGRQWGSEAAYKFADEYGFWPQIKRFDSDEYFSCISCHEKVFNMDEPHIHEAWGMGVDHDSEEYKILEIYEFDEGAFRGDRITPMKNARIVNKKTGNVVKEFVGGRGSFRQYLAKASGYIQALEEKA